MKGVLQNWYTYTAEKTFQKYFLRSLFLSKVASRHSAKLINMDSFIGAFKDLAQLFRIFRTPIFQNDPKYLLLIRDRKWGGSQEQVVRIILKKQSSKYYPCISKSNIKNNNKNLKKITKISLLNTLWRT